MSIMRSHTTIIVRLCTVLLVVAVASGCVPSVVHKDADRTMPARFAATDDTVSTGDMSWRAYYADTNLLAMIDSALHRNQELNIVLQEISIAQNEVDARRGEYLPFVHLRAGADAEKAGAYTRSGAVEEQLEVRPGERFPTPLPTFTLGADVSWEVDIWRRLRNATDAATLRYLSSIEGTNYLVTNIVAEVAASYYELMAMDNLLEAIDANIEIQRRALHIVEQQKQAAKATELAVRKFEAEVLKNESRRYEVKQRIVELENRINALLGRYPQPVPRDATSFLAMRPDSVRAGLPTQLLERRPDVKQAELAMQAADLDVASAKARFYPSLNITAGAGYSSFNAQYLFTTPESMIYNVAGELLMPVINRNAIKAAYMSAGAKQVQAAYAYERTLLQAYIEVANDLAKLENLQRAFDRKQAQVEALTSSVDISNNLFLSARADYMEVLMTQRDALEARMELIETKMEQMRTYVHVYKALGGGWK